MTGWPEIQVCFVLPSGVATVPFEGGALTCRVAVGHLDAPDTGLIDEMRSGAEPVPWRSAILRDEALRAIEERSDLEDRTRRRLLAHVRRTPWYE